MTNLIGAAITLGVGLLGVGVGWGALKAQAAGNAKRIVKIETEIDHMTGRNPGGQPQWVRRDECAARHSEITDQLREQARAIKSLQRFAQWKMAKDGATLPEINRTLNGE